MNIFIICRHVGWVVDANSCIWNLRSILLEDSLEKRVDIENLTSCHLYLSYRFSPHLCFLEVLQHRPNKKHFKEGIVYHIKINWQNTHEMSSQPKKKKIRNRPNSLVLIYLMKKIKPFFLCEPQIHLHSTTLPCWRQLYLKLGHFNHQ